MRLWCHPQPQLSMDATASPSIMPTGATAQVKGTLLTLRQGAISPPQHLCRHKLLLVSAGIWDMTCVLKPLPHSSHLGLILAVFIPVAVALAAIGLLVLICWRFGEGFARQWDAMRVARLKRRQAQLLCCSSACVLLQQCCSHAKPWLAASLPSDCCRQPPGTLKEGQGGLGLAPKEVRPQASTACQQK